MKKLKAFIWLFIMLGIVIGGLYNGYRYLSGTEAREIQQEIDNMHNLVNNGIKVTGSYSEQFEIKTVGDIEVGIYNDYSFNVNGKDYSGRVELYEPPMDLYTEVYYLKSNPSIHAINPKEELVKIQSHKGSKGILWFSIGMICIGLIGLTIILFNFRPSQTTIK